MSKFKVGDKVIGNKKANTYVITKEGYVGTVLAINGCDFEISASENVLCDSFVVSIDCFDLYEPKEVRDYIETDIKITSIVVDEKKCEIGGEKMNNILNIYKERKEREIDTKYKEIVNKEYSEIEFVKVYNGLIETFEKTLEDLYNDESNKDNNYLVHTGISTSSYKYKLSEDIKYEIMDKYDHDKDKEYIELRKLVDEVEAQLSLCENREQSLEVLKNYNIIDKKTLKINA